MELRIGRREVDQIIRVSESSVQFPALSVIEKSGDLLAEQWPGEPLHIVLHEDLHRRAIDRPRSLNRTVNAAPDGHVGTEKRDCRFQIADLRLGRTSLSTVSCGSFHPIGNLQSAI